MPSPYPQQRILAPRTVLVGNGNPNALENILVDPYPDGAECYVLDQDSLYILDKFASTAVSPPDVIATARGASAPGRWVKYPAGGGGGALPIDIVERIGLIIDPGSTSGRVYPYLGEFTDFAQVLIPVVNGDQVVLEMTPVTYFDPAVSDNIGMYTSLQCEASVNSGGAWSPFGSTVTFGSDNPNELIVAHIKRVYTHVGASVNLLLRISATADASTLGGFVSGSPNQQGQGSLIGMRLRAS